MHVNHVFKVLLQPFNWFDYYWFSWQIILLIQ